MYTQYILHIHTPNQNVYYIHKCNISGSQNNIKRWVHLKITKTVKPKYVKFELPVLFF